MKKILVFSNSSWNIYNFRLNLLLFLKSKKFKIYILSPNDAFSEKLIKHGFSHKRINVKSNRIAFFSDIYLFINILKFINYIKPDYVLSFTIKPNLYSVISSYFIKFKCIINVTGLGTMYFKSFYIKKIYLLIYRFIIKKADYTMFQNKDDYLLLNNKKRKSKILPGSGINLNQYKYYEKKSSTEITFLFVGRMLKEKGLIEFLKASEIIKKKYSNAVFQILGNYDERNPSSIDKNELNYYVSNNYVKVNNFRENITTLLIECDCVVLPSYREGTSRVLLEAGSTGTPSITSDVTGCNNVIKDGFNGFLCESKNIYSLVDAIVKFYKLSQYEKNIMGKNARVNIESNFDEKIIFEEYFSILND